MKDILERYQWPFLIAAMLLAVALWVPGLQYPIFSDTANYALLGESIWHGDGYTLMGEPYAKHLPFHAITAYPLVFFFGYNFGMKFASLLAGLAVILWSFLLARKQFSVSVAVLTAFFVALHHGFVWMTVVGSADLLFTALFLFGVYAFLRAEDDANWYLLAGAAWGLSCVTRYNGMPLLALYVVYGLLARPQHRKSMSFWCGILLGGGIFVVWLLRNYHVFGNPFFTEYTSELQGESAGPIAQLVSNLFYYLNPLQNILPILLLLACYGVWKEGRRHVFLIVSIIAILLLTAIWWVQAMRFAFPAYPILIMFAAWVLYNFQFSIFNYQFTKVIIGLLIVITHLGALCLYSSGACNALFDRTIGGIPANLGITSEGFYTWHQAQHFINAYAKDNANLYVIDTVKQQTLPSVFRSDIHLTVDTTICPYYEITAEPVATDDVLFTTKDAPHTSVVLRQCPTR